MAEHHNAWEILNYEEIFSQNEVMQAGQYVSMFLLKLNRIVCYLQQTALYVVIILQFILLFQEFPTK